jgi:hypothetical protein
MAIASLSTRRPPERPRTGSVGEERADALSLDAGPFGQPLDLDGPVGIQVREAAENVFDGGQVACDAHAERHAVIVEGNEQAAEPGWP